MGVVRSKPSRILECGSDSLLQEIQGIVEGIEKAIEVTKIQAQAKVKKGWYNEQIKTEIKAFDDVEG